MSKAIRQIRQRFLLVEFLTFTIFINVPSLLCTVLIACK
jgi:hypothetical protein